MKGNQRAIALLRKNDHAMIQLLPTLVIAVVLVYAFLYVGTYINGTIASELEDSFGANRDRGHLDNTYYHNGTGSTNVSRNETLPVTIANLNQTITAFSIYSNHSSWNNVSINVTSNGNDVILDRNIINGTWYNRTIAQLISGGNVTSTDTYLNWTFNCTSNKNQIRVRYYAPDYRASEWRTTHENKTVSLMGNISDSFDDSVDIVGVAVIIVVITFPLMALVGLRRLM